MTLDLDDLTDQLRHEADAIAVSPDLADVRGRARSLRRRRRVAGAGATAAIAVALGAGAVVWANPAAGPHRVAIADGTPTTAPVPAAAPLEGHHDIPAGTLTYRVGSAASGALARSVPTVCRSGALMEITFTPRGGTEQRIVVWATHTPDRAVAIQLAHVFAKDSAAQPLLVAAVGLEDGRYRATFPDGSVDDADAIGGGVVFVGTSGPAGDPTGGPAQIDLERLGDDGHVVRRWSAADLAEGPQDFQPVTTTGECVELQSLAPSGG